MGSVKTTNSFKNKVGRPRKKPTEQFGGRLLKGHPRHERPLSYKKPLHITLRTKAKSSLHLLQPRAAREVQKLVALQAQRQKIKIYRYKNMGTQLHLVVLVPKRKNYQIFIRGLTSRISMRLAKLNQQKGTLQKVTAHKLALPKELKDFWQDRPYTRIINWGQNFLRAKEEFWQSTLNALGLNSNPKSKNELNRILAYIDPSQYKPPLLA